jgi:hypothetical protein
MQKNSYYSHSAIWKNQNIGTLEKIYETFSTPLVCVRKSRLLLLIIPNPALAALRACNVPSRQHVACKMSQGLALLRL